MVNCEIGQYWRNEATEDRSLMISNGTRSRPDLSVRPETLGVI